MRKYWYRRFLLVLLVLSVLGYAGYEITKRQEQGRKKEVSAGSMGNERDVREEKRERETSKRVRERGV